MQHFLEKIESIFATLCEEERTYLLEVIEHEVEGIQEYEPSESDDDSDDYSSDCDDEEEDEDDEDDE